MVVSNQNFERETWYDRILINEPQNQSLSALGVSSSHLTCWRPFSSEKPIHVQKSVDWTEVLRNFGTCLKKSRMYDYIPCRCRNIKAEFAISMPFSFLFIFSFFSYFGRNFCFQASSKIGWMDVLRIAGRKTISTLLHYHWALDGRCPHTTTPSDGRRVSSLKMKWKYVLHICHGRCDFVLKYLMTVIILFNIEFLPVTLNVRVNSISYKIRSTENVYVLWNVTRIFT